MNETEEIKSRLPIEHIVGKYVPLKKAGRVFKGLCPFHNERTPSFTVNPERNIYKCFGCGEGGDIFDFTMKIEGLTFPESLRLLAEQAGVQLEEKVVHENTGPGKDRLFGLNEYITKVWHALLLSHPKAAHARTYVQARGLTDATMRTFRIGFAPPGSTTLQALQKHGFTNEEISAAGEPGRFQGRLVFPICDITGRVIGFTGRILVENVTAPKYWNTPETPLFVKSRAVFALHLAKQAIHKEGLAILAEGQMDVVSLHQAGYQNAVASSGTALTPQQLRLIARFSENVAFAYDSDKAGIAATERGLELALREGLNPFVIVIPNGKDPADCLAATPELWQEAYTGKLPFMEWLLLRHVPTKLDPRAKKEAASLLAPWLQLIKSPIERADWMRLIAARLQIDEQALDQPTEPEHSAPTTAFTSTNIRNPLQERAEAALALVVAFPEVFTYVKEQLPDLARSGETPFLQTFLSRLTPETESLDQVTATLSAEERKTFLLDSESAAVNYVNIELDKTMALGEVLSILARIRSEARESAKSMMAQQISSAQASGDQNKVRELLLQLKEMV